MPILNPSRLFVVRIFFILAIVLLILISFLLLRRINMQVASADQANSTNLIRLYVVNIFSKVQNAEAGQRGFLLTKDSSFLVSCRIKLREIVGDLKVLDSIAEGHNSKTKIDTMRFLTNRRLSIIDSNLQLFSQNGDHIDNGALKSGRAVMDSLEGFVGKLVNSEMQLLTREQIRKDQYVFITPRFVLLLALFTLLVFTFSFISLNKQLRLSNNYLQQKQKALNDLEEMNMIYQNAEQVASLGSWQLNLDTDMFKCSDNLFRIYGSEPRNEEVSYHRFLSFVHPGDREKLAGYIEKAIQSRETTEATYRIIRTDGEIRYLTAVGKIVSNGERILLGTARDVTEMIAAVEKLRESESFNRNITELVPNFIYIFDLENKTLVYMNRDPEEVLGYTLEELTTPGFELIGLLHPDDLPATLTRQDLIRKMKDGEVMISEYRFRHKNGEWVNILARSTCFKRNSDGAISQIIGVAADVTEQKKTSAKLSNLNKELQEKNKELQQTNAELSSFNFIASHDLQEPLRKIQTFASFLEASETNLSGTGRLYLQRMLHSVTRIRMLIRDILAYSHSTLLERRWDSVDLNAVLNNAEESMREAILQNNATIRSDKLPVVKGNIHQLQQLFENLLSNAFKYSRPDLPPQVVITFETTVPEHETEVELELGRAYHKISFADNGIGFEQEYAEKIFDLFQRLHSKSEYEGSGIGLAICKKIAQHHGGNILARSKPGEGSVFDVYLPA